MTRGSPWVVRSARIADASEMLGIYEPIVRETAISFEVEPPTVDVFAERIERTLATDPWLVVEHNGAIAGYAYASQFRARPAYATTRETTVYVHADHRGLGAGRQLLSSLLADVGSRGAHLAVAVIALPNDASVALHESLGFVLVGRIGEVARKFDRWHDEGFWVYRFEQ